MIETPEQLEQYVAHEVAGFVRDNMRNICQAPADYDDWFEYLRELYIIWNKEQLSGEDL